MRSCVSWNHPFTSLEQLWYWQAGPSRRFYLDWVWCSYPLCSAQCYCSLGTKMLRPQPHITKWINRRNYCHYDMVFAELVYYTTKEVGLISCLWKTCSLFLLEKYERKELLYADFNASCYVLHRTLLHAIFATEGWLFSFSSIASKDLRLAGWCLEFIDIYSTQ